MPVDLLFCEGVSGGADVIVISKILMGAGCEVEPKGSKHIIGEAILNERKSRKTDDVCGILDGDFMPIWNDVNACPMPRLWKIGKPPVTLGWRWARKEIENYLIDPVVVRHALDGRDFDFASYNSELNNARDAISYYQAARISLSASRPNQKPLNSAFGKLRGKNSYPFPVCLENSACNNGIANNVLSYKKTKPLFLETVLKLYKKKYIKECCTVDEFRYRDYLYAFSGKDLLFAMSTWLAGNGFQSPQLFINEIVREIHNSKQDVSTWLPEWDNLRSQVLSC